MEVEGQTVIVQPVGAMGKTWAHIILVLHRKPQEYEYLILDSASLVHCAGFVAETLHGRAEIVFADPVGR